MSHKEKFEQLYSLINKNRNSNEANSYIEELFYLIRFVLIENDNVQNKINKITTDYKNENNSLKEELFLVKEQNKLLFSRLSKKLTFTERLFGRID